jgi:hypothetical protein
MGAAVVLGPGVVELGSAMSERRPQRAGLEEARINARAHQFLAYRVAAGAEELGRRPCSKTTRVFLRRPEVVKLAYHS